ncbi:hypothetical protein L1987_19145 [Smallanthus sonchifolius]|uniref:Uncharacterized protein n=1 Tax=Smallanthus sonchifolius TaxID=185202 RepID=A0ACB9J3S4_9ASTR|nr:hypothetical protein L1987_19145 [Smallanthus sonchifolius]
MRRHERKMKYEKKQETFCDGHWLTVRKVGPTFPRDTRGSQFQEKFVRPVSLEVTPCTERCIEIMRMRGNLSSEYFSVVGNR